MTQAPQAWLDEGFTQDEWDRQTQVERVIEDLMAKMKERGL